MYAPAVDIIIVLLAILVGALVVGLIAAWAHGFGRTATYLRLLWWRLRGAKTAPEIPAGAIAVEHPDTALAKQALHERIARARARAEKQTAADAAAVTPAPELSDGDEIVLLDEDNERLMEPGETDGRR